MSSPSEDDTGTDTDAADGTGHGDAPPAPDPGSGCAEIRLDSGDLVIYDGRTHDAWLQSSVAVEIAALAGPFGGGGAEP